jgi:hypothetical protein
MLEFPAHNNAPCTQATSARHEGSTNVVIQPRSKRQTPRNRRHKVPRQVSIRWVGNKKVRRLIVRIQTCAFALAILIFATAQAQQLDNSASDKQIIANILKESRELYMKSVGVCACADDCNKEGTRCNKVIKEQPETFKPFCTRKDVSLRELSLYRM